MAKKTNKTGVRILFLSFLLLTSPFLAKSATMSFMPSSATFSVGERIVIKVVVNGDVPLNAVSGEVFLPTSHLSIESISKSNSLISFWIRDPSFSKTIGTVRFEGVMTDPFQGNGGLVLNITVKAVKEGTVNVGFSEGQILANDGNGTDITGSLNKAVFTIIPAKPKTETPRESLPEIIPTVVDLKPPIISLGKQNGLQSIIGESDYPKADVILTFVSNEGSKVYVTGITGNDGKFNITTPKSLRDGGYFAYASMLIGDRQSKPSNTIYVKVGHIILIYIFELVIFSLFLIVLLFLWIRRKNSQKKIKEDIRREANEAEEVLEKSLDVIRDDISDSKSISSKELKKMRGDLTSSEKAVKKEIEDIKSIKIDDI